MALCDLCLSIPLSEIPPFPEIFFARHVPCKGLVPYRLKRGIKLQDVTLGYRHQPSLAALNKSAPSCDLCALILESIRDQIRRWEEARQDEQFAFYDKSGWPLQFDLWITKRVDDQDGFFILTPAAEESRDVYLVAAVGFCVDKDDPLAAVFPGRPVAESGSEESLNRALGWVKACNENHPGCNTGEVPLPFRVLDVGDLVQDKRVRLLETAGMNGQYITLSHCWGTLGHLTTTSENILMQYAGIEIATMPKTFRDAVTITRHLGIRYLWIDSLCICQDDGKDWERESAKMAATFENSYLTISARSAAHNEAGCFRPPKERMYAKLPYRPQEGKAGSVKAFTIDLESAASAATYIAFEDEPLTKRAWVLQERLLPPRSLYFCSDQMHYECREEFFSEDGYKLKSYKSELNGMISKYWDEEDKKFPTIREYDCRGHQLWHNLVSMYTPLQLTKSSDKLPALSGLARYFEKLWKDQYIAGLWRNSLVEGLLWQGLSRTTRRVTRYRAPSWSWASIDGHSCPVDIGRFEDVAEILNVIIKMKGENPYGEIEKGEIKIRAPLIPTFPSDVEKPGEKELPHRMAPRLRTKTGNPFGSYAMFDISSEEYSVKNLELFQLVLVRDKNCEKQEERLYESLIVVPVDGHEGYFLRIGKMLPTYDQLYGDKEIEDEVASQAVILV